MDDIQLINERPLILINKNQNISKKLSSIANEICKELKAEPFEFPLSPGKMVKDKLRYIYPINKSKLNLEIKELIKDFSKNTLPKYLKKLREKLSSVDYESCFNKNLGYTLRVRIFEDQMGYSLQPHQDSNDTIFSFILQLSESNPTTSIYTIDKIHQKKLIKSISNELLNENFSDLLKEINKNGLIFSKSQFTDKVGAWSSDEKFYSWQIEDLNLYILEHSETSILLKNCDMYAIHNAQKGLFKSGKYEKYNYQAFHGVRPTVKPNRRLLIMDLIARETKDNVLVMNGINNDESTYYVIFRKETSNYFSELLR
jgi:hypothetical protein